MIFHEPECVTHTGMPKNLQFVPCAGTNSVVSAPVAVPVSVMSLAAQLTVNAPLVVIV